MTVSAPWQSWCVYLGARDQFDLFISDVLAKLPIAQDKWFFIRYGAGGPHLRIRIQSSSQQHAVAAEALLRQNAETMAAERVDSAWYKSVTFPGGVGHSPGTVCALPYEPEVARYGGPDAIAVNEALFCGSSKLAVRTVAWAQGSSSRLQPHALDMMLAVVAVLFDSHEEAATYFRTYSRGWDHYLRELGRLLPDPAAGVPLDAPAIKFRLTALIALRKGAERADGLTGVWMMMIRATRDQLGRLAAGGRLNVVAHGKGEAGDPARASIANILGSQMHMMNNRLGFSPVDEIRWAQQLACALDQP